MRSLILAVALLTPLAAHCQEDAWTHYGTSTTGDDYSFNASSMRRIGPNISYWVKKEGRDGVTMAQIEIDCPNREFRFRAYTSFDTAGKLAGQSSTPEDWQPSVPGTVLGNMINNGCAALEKTD